MFQGLATGPSLKQNRDQSSESYTLLLLSFSKVRECSAREGKKDLQVGGTQNLQKLYEWLCSLCVRYGKARFSQHKSKYDCERPPTAKSNNNFQFK